ncbi:MAG: hypothetical protein COA88_09545 [Kordia sp.]|nr:MAG: hypothetical protein COA88_09545 [Kordia sp.]
MSLFLIWLLGLTVGSKICLVAFVGIMYFLHLHRTIGKDGADLLRMVIAFIMVLCLLVEDSIGKQLFLAFTGFQILLGYTTSGTLKLLSPYWRKGDVLAPILSTYSFGHPTFSKWLYANPRIEFFFCYMSIVSMLSVIVCFIFPHQMPIIIALSIMLSFHLTVTFLMGLNDFLWVFPACYPGVLYLHFMYSSFIIPLLQ